MKLKISELHSNPHKKEINKGHLDKEQVARIKSNIKELGLMGSMPVVIRNGKYHLISGHHRLQALKEVYGKDFQVEIIKHNYNDEQLMRGMIIENLTQRTDDFREINENLVMIRSYLKKNDCSNSEQSSKKLDTKGRENRQQEAGSIRHIADWLL